MYDDPIALSRQQAFDMVAAACALATEKGVLPNVPAPDFIIEVPADSEHGDFASNIALIGARVYKMAPKVIAEIICEHIVLHDFFERVSVAGPGFINFFLNAPFYSHTVSSVLQNGESYGRTNQGVGQKVMVEFVSANPTGPIHLGNARGGALGDCIAAALDWSGHTVSREFYVNDAGNQIEKFGLSLEARYLQLFRKDTIFPEDGYQGADITELAQEFAVLHGNSLVDAPSTNLRQKLVAYALPRNIQKLQEDLRLYRVNFDVWFHESTLHNDGTVQKVIDLLTANGYTYESDGALWYKASALGGEKDEVLVKSNGFYTYFAVDVAYHYNKFVVRGFQRVINCWGADHHGHVARIKGAMDALGIGGERLDVVLYQLVNLVRDGQPVRMSKRTGKTITLTDLLEEIPIDAARFYFNLREYSSHFEFDLDLAVKQSADNPVYYAQYAHARICSILKMSDPEVIVPDAPASSFPMFAHKDERALIVHLARFPSEIAQAAYEREPARLTRYAINLATLFHRFYTTCRVRVDDKNLCSARTALCAAAKQVLENCLSILKITAPEAM